MERELRDEIAIEAMKKCLENNDRTPMREILKKVGEVSYAIADAMLQARDRKV